mmetsp:Transcript_11034/g.36635  ORF Transcript_11034/g.36635 Transcript_11034/m.36635 type:complete len:215 (-) Transcript_11034:774-1418(-)
MRPCCMSARRWASTLGLRRRSTGCSTSTPPRARRWCGSRGAIRLCLAGAARSSSTSRRGACRCRSCRASPRPRASQPRSASRSLTGTTPTRSASSRDTRDQTTQPRSPSGTSGRCWPTLRRRWWCTWASRRCRSSRTGSCRPACRAPRRRWLFRTARPALNAWLMPAWATSLPRWSRQASSRRRSSSLAKSLRCSSAGRRPRPAPRPTRPTKRA